MCSIRRSFLLLANDGLADLGRRGRAKGSADSPLAIDKSGRARNSSDFPTRFPTELLTTGWEMTRLDGW